MPEFDLRTSRDEKNDDLLAFGYELYEEGSYKMRIGGHNKDCPQYYYRRSKDLKNYSLLKEKEDEYNALQDKIEYIEDINTELVILLFILLILPGIIYLIYKKRERERVMAANPLIKEEMYKVVEQAKLIEVI